MGLLIRAIAVSLVLQSAAFAATIDTGKAPPTKEEPSRSPTAPTPTAKGEAPAKQESAKGAPSTRGETAKADENRKKPLQRCDQLKDQAQLQCLKKARQQIVEARAKREAKAAK